MFSKNIRFSNFLGKKNNHLKKKIKKDLKTNNFLKIYPFLHSLNKDYKYSYNKKKLKYFKKFIKNNENISFIDESLKVAIITPDKDIIPGAETLSPAYIVFDNYEIILKWNRSLRFALAVCTLKDKIKNEI